MDADRFPLVFSNKVNPDNSDVKAHQGNNDSPKFKVFSFKLRDVIETVLFCCKWFSNGCFGSDVKRVNGEIVINMKTVLRIVQLLNTCHSLTTSPCS